MKTKILIAAIMGALMLLILPAAADYSGDHPLVPVESGTIKGDVLFLVEDDTDDNYLLLNEPPLGDKPSVTQTFSVSIPDGAEVTSARLYNYYTWSKVEGDKLTAGAPAEANITLSRDSMPLIDVNLINPDGCDVTSCDNPIVYVDDQEILNYWDSKSTTSGVKYNTPYGNIVIDVTEMVTESGTYTATIEHASNGNTIQFVTYGFALLIVYEDDAASPISYWITEGADVLMSSDTYGITPEDATTVVLNPVGFNKGWHNMKILAAGTNNPFKDSQQSLTEILLDGNKIQTFPLVTSKALSLYDKDVLLKNKYNNIFSVRDKGDMYTVFNAVLVDR